MLDSLLDNLEETWSLEDYEQPCMFTNGGHVSCENPADLRVHWEGCPCSSSGIIRYYCMGCYSGILETSPDHIARIRHLSCKQILLALTVVSVK